MFVGNQDGIKPVGALADGSEAGISFAAVEAGVNQHPRRLGGHKGRVPFAATAEHADPHAHAASGQVTVMRDKQATFNFKLPMIRSARLWTSKHSPSAVPSSGGNSGS